MIVPVGHSSSSGGDTMTMLSRDFNKSPYLHLWLRNSHKIGTVNTNFGEHPFEHSFSGPDDVMYEDGLSYLDSMSIGHFSSSVGDVIIKW